METMGMLWVAIYVNAFAVHQRDRKIIVLRAHGVTKSKAKALYTDFKAHNSHLRNAICEAKWQAESETLNDE